MRWKPANLRTRARYVIKTHKGELTNTRLGESHPQKKYMSPSRRHRNIWYSWALLVGLWHLYYRFISTITRRCTCWYSSLPAYTAVIFQLSLSHTADKCSHNAIFQTDVYSRRRKPRFMVSSIVIQSSSNPFNVLWRANFFHLPRCLRCLLFEAVVENPIVIPLANWADHVAATSHVVRAIVFRSGRQKKEVCQ